MRRVRESAKSQTVGQPGSTGPGQPAAPAPMGQAEAAAKAREQWTKEGPAILSSFESSGQCTDWAAQKRPDLIQRVYEADWTAQFQGLTEPAVLGGASSWPTAAAAVGFQISEVPVQGALVVWQPGVEGAGEESGHVGYVESVSPDGSTFSTSEMNFGGPFLMGYRTLSTIPVAGRTFILP